jgi:hypothetical protein
MRTGFRAEDLYLVFDGGAFGGPHGHEDKLSVVCSAYGRAMLVDPGSFTYDGSHPFRKYFVSSFGHNTVVVDGLSQARGRQAASYRFKPGPSPLWEKGELGEYVEARYDEGYADFRRWRDPADRSVVHTRGVLFVKPDYWVVLDRLEGKGSHRLTRLFHLAPGEARTVPGGAAGADSGMANLFLLAPEPDVVVSVVKGSEDPIQGWYSSGYNAKEPAPAILFEGTSNLPASLVTALIPARPGESAHATVDRIDLPGGGVLVIVTGGGDEAGEDLIVWPGPRSPAGSAGGLAWAAGLRVGLARIDAAGNARIWKVGEGDLRAGGPGRAVTSPSKGEGAGR